MPDNVAAVNADEAPLPYENFLKILRRPPGKLTEPIREDIYSVERLEQYATHLAREFRLRPNARRGPSLLPKVKRYGRELQRAYLTLGLDFRAQRTVSPAAEWLLDNFHIVQEQLANVKRDLPPKYYDELPKLASGELAGYPRIYAMALAILAHTDSHLEVDSLRRFLQAFQRVSPLKIGELWAVAITLRIALLEHLKNLAERVVQARRKREDANVLADTILERVVDPNTHSADLVDLLSRELDKPENVDHAFIEQLTQRLRDQDPDVWPVFDWLEKFLRKHDTSTARIVQLEHQRQAGAQATVGNVISSLRLLQALDWRDFFESCSTVDPILAQDPAGAYWGMDFHTRDRYRHAVERIALRARRRAGDADSRPTGESHGAPRGGARGKNTDTWAENEVAMRAVQWAKAAADRIAARASEESDESGRFDARRSHVGYYLIGDGLRDLERDFAYAPTFRDRLARVVHAAPTAIYLGSIFTFTAAGLAALAYALASADLRWTARIPLLVLAAWPASELALGVVNTLVLYWMRPKLLPKMDSEHGIPDGARTLVVIPTLFTTPRGIDALLRNLEVYSLANDEKNLAFALLADFADADAETTSRDAELIARASDGIARLNAEHARAAGPRERPAFSSSTAAVSGIRPKENGWVGNANAERSSSSIG